MPQLRRQNPSENMHFFRSLCYLKVGAYIFKMLLLLILYLYYIYYVCYYLTRRPIQYVYFNRFGILGFNKTGFECVDVLHGWISFEFFNGSLVLSLD